MSSGVFGMALETVMHLAMEGRVRPKHLWVAMKGAAKYKAALAEPNALASDLEAQARAEVCNRCSTKFTTMVERDNTALGKYGRVQLTWCGKPLEETLDGLDGKGPTCGCLVGVRCLSEQRTEDIARAAEDGTGVWFDSKSPVEKHYAAGGMMAAGKCVVRAEECPRKHWHAITFRAG